MPLPNSSFYPLFPLQQQLINSTTGLPLSAGIVSFYQDIARTVPKNVYQRTENPDNTFTYTSLGNTVYLSSIGTYVDESGNNITVFLWPYTGSPSDVPPSTTIDLYYITVQSNGFVPQFTVSAWPPGVTSSSSGSNDFISSENIISNPQFAVINYSSPYTFNVEGNSTIQIAPDWNILTTGSGTVTINQIAMTDTNAPGLPAFGLRITSAGISSLLLSQTIEMSPRILENGYASGTFIVESNNGFTPTISMNYVPSNPALESAQIVSGIAVIGGYLPYFGTVNLADLTTNANPGSTGYVNIQISIPPNTDINLSCLQLLSVQNGDTFPLYIQETTPRQIDHLYHDAYPIVPIGTIIDYAGFSAPSHYLLCDGTAKSRVTYNQLYNALTLVQSITQITSTTFTVTSAAQLGLNMPLEGTGIPFGTYITIISGTTITVNQATTVPALATISATFYAFGQGDGSTTFDVPNLTGKVSAGTGGNLVAISPLVDAVGQNAGAGNVVLNANQIAPHTHAATITSGANNAGSGDGNTVYTTNFSGAPHASSITIANNVPSPSLQVVNIIQPTVILYKYIRYE